MCEKISTGGLVSPDQARQIEAALKLVEQDQTQFAESEGVPRQVLNEVIRRRRVPTADVAEALNRLLESAPWPRISAAA